MSYYPMRDSPIQLLVLCDMFVREHNFRAREAKKANPTWNDEELFREARRLVVGALQRIASDEWLTHMVNS